MPQDRKPDRESHGYVSGTVSLGSITGKEDRGGLEPGREFEKWASEQQRENDTNPPAPEGETLVNTGPVAARLGQGSRTCQDIMTPNPQCCIPIEPVSRAARIMKTENVGPVPVVENRQINKLIGIVTDRDLALQVVAAGRDPRNTTVEEVMSRDLVTCHPDDDIQQAIQAMETHQVRRIPVVNEKGYLLGIISQADIATHLNQPQQVAEVVEQISEP